MSGTTSAGSSSGSEFYRCPIAAERKAAIVKIGRHKLRIVVHEASIDGFTVLVQASSAGRLVLGKSWVLFHDGVKLEVHPQWFFHAEDGTVQVGLRRLRDLTKPPAIGGWFPTFGQNTEADGSGGSLVFVGAVLAVGASLALPGVGDALGTSGKIQQLIASIFSQLRGFFG